MATTDTFLVHTPQPSFAANKVGIETVKKAVNALLKWRSAKLQTQKAQLLEPEDFIYLILTLKKIPSKSRINAYKIPLPHSLHTGSELCLIIDGRPKSNLTSEVAKKKIESEDIPISKVIRLSKLKSDYKSFEAKRKLCDSYDVFFADKRVVPLLPRLLGKNFFGKKKIPVPVDLGHNNWKEQIEKACSSAMLYLRTGTCSVMKVGMASMGREEIVENVIEAIEGILGLVPKKWEGVRSFHLKFTESLALPIYQAVPDMMMKIGGKRKLGEVVGEESAGDEEVGGEKIKKQKKTKGRIHEVKYMDSDLGVIGDDSESENEEKEESYCVRKGYDSKKGNEETKGGKAMNFVGKKSEDKAKEVKRWNKGNQGQEKQGKNGTFA